MCPTTGVTSQLLLNGLHWMLPSSENVLINTTEEWTVVNLAGDTHPIHLHLAGMQLIKRQTVGWKSF
jgi:spore coat protein A